MFALALAPFGARGVEYANDILSRVEQFQGILRLGEKLKSPRLCIVAARELHSLERMMRATTDPSTGREIHALHREIQRRMEADRRQKEIRRKRKTLLEARLKLRESWAKWGAGKKEAGPGC